MLRLGPPTKVRRVVLARPRTWRRSNIAEKRSTRAPINGASHARCTRRSTGDDRSSRQTQRRWRQRSSVARSSTSLRIRVSRDASEWRFVARCRRSPTIGSRRSRTSSPSLSATSRRVQYVIGAAIAIALVVSISTIATRHGPSRCEGLDRPMRAAWTETIRADLRARLLATGVGLHRDHGRSGTARPRHVRCELDDHAHASLHGLAAGRSVSRDARLAHAVSRSSARPRCRACSRDSPRADNATLRATSDAVAQLHPVTECSDAKDLARSPGERRVADRARHRRGRAGARDRVRVARSVRARTAARRSRGRSRASMPALRH